MIHRHCPPSRLCLIGFAGICLSLSAALGAAGELGAPLAPTSKRKILFDDYYQKKGPDARFTQGVPLNPDDRRFTNFYSPAANAIPNGTFVLSGLISDKFETAVSEKPLSPELLQGVDAYLLICPIKPEAGAPADLTERDADILEAYVARGGMLGLILNSLPSDPAKTEFNVPGMNRIARRFGLEFLRQETKTVLIPVAKDNPVFDGVRAVIYGNGTTIRLLPSANPHLAVLLRDPRPGPHDPVGLITPYKKGKVLLFGDSGTFGNAHAFRSDTDQAKADQEMIYGLLPDGPAPAYGWKPGTKLRVHVSQEQIFSCYPQGNRLFRLPKAPGTQLIESGVRSLDVDSSPHRKANPGRYASVLKRQEASFQLEIGAHDGGAFAASWRSDSGEAASCRILPRGSILHAAIPQGNDLRDWQWALDAELIASPLRAYAQPGEVWQATALAPLPQADLAQVPTLRESPATFRFEGEGSYAGQPCFLFTRTISLAADGWTPRDVVSPEYISACGPGQIEFVAGGLYAVTKYWVNRNSLLPVHTEMTISSSLWWKDEDYPDSYSGSHDWKNYEGWTKISFVGTFGRVVTADFSSEPAP